MGLLKYTERMIKENRYIETFLPFYQRKELFLLGSLFKINNQLKMIL